MLNSTRQTSPIEGFFLSLFTKLSCAIRSPFAFRAIPICRRRRLQIFQRSFFVLFLAVVGVFASTTTVYAQGEGGNLTGVFKQDAKTSASDDVDAANTFMSDMIWWIRRIALFITIILFIIAAILYGTGKAPLNVIVPAIVAIALIGGGIEIVSRLFFDIGSESAR